MDLLNLFPPNLARVMKRIANAFSVPYAGVMNLLLSLAGAYSPTSFAISPSGGQIEPIMLNFLNVGASGINKSGLTKVHEYIFKQTQKTLAAVCGDVSSLSEKGICINRLDIPVLDFTSTPAASIQKASRHRNLLRYDDELQTKLRSLSNESGGSNKDNGAQHHLVAYNSPEEVVNDLKGGIETCRFSRYNSVANAQPSVIVDVLGSLSSLFSIGYTARNSLILLESNFDVSGRHSSLTMEEQNMLPFSIAMAARGMGSMGNWTDEGIDAESVKKTF